MIVDVTKYGIGSVLALYATATMYGSYLSKVRKELPFDAKACEKAGCRHVASRDGTRVVAYYVFGSDRPDAKVVVFCHGMGDEGSFFPGLLLNNNTNNKIFEQRNIKAIAPALPGHGFSDTQKGRTIGNWPRDDLEPILKRELQHLTNKKFIVQGISFGSAHALACGAYFEKDRCVGIGVIAPFLSTELCTEFGLDDDEKNKKPQIPSIDFYDKIQNAWIFVMYAMCHNKYVLGNVAKMTEDGKKAMVHCPEVMDHLSEISLRKSSIRGTVGIVLDEFTDMARKPWGFTLEDIKTKHVAVWYSPDDTVLSPMEGQCLAEYFDNKKEMTTDIRKNGGAGHYTYLSKKYQEQGFQTESLLHLCRDCM